jgi:hypothetical protein
MFYFAQILFEFDNFNASNRDAQFTLIDEFYLRISNFIKNLTIMPSNGKTSVHTLEINSHFSLMKKDEFS